MFLISTNLPKKLLKTRFGTLKNTVNLLIDLQCLLPKDITINILIKESQNHFDIRKFFNNLMCGSTTILKCGSLFHMYNRRRCLCVKKYLKLCIKKEICSVPINFSTTYMYNFSYSWLDICFCCACQFQQMRNLTHK